MREDWKGLQMRGNRRLVTADDKVMHFLSSGATDASLVEPGAMYNSQLLIPKRVLPTNTRSYRRIE